jgi:3-deoxy-D-manno-octulosonate 8-phosphate phosphatase KdsC-like HAD superfamily phosphatase
VARVQWASIKLLALDVDGVLTDGGLTFDENGSLLQTFNVRDGFALVAARRAGLKIAWISGRASRVAEHRFKELDLHHCILACADKGRRDARTATSIRFLAGALLFRRRRLARFTGLCAVRHSRRRSPML